MNARALFTMATLLASASIAPAQDKKIPDVSVIKPALRDVIDRVEQLGRTEAAAKVDLRARASGYLVKVNFEDGAAVKRGDVLFEIDPRPYQLRYDAARVKLLQAESTFQGAKANLDRFKSLPAGAKSEYDVGLANVTVEQARGNMEVAKIDLDLAKLNLDFTKVTAPMDGRVSRRRLDVGNLVKADETLLATLVNLDRIAVYFEIPEMTAVGLRQLGKLEGLPVQIGLESDAAKVLKGSIDFSDSRLDPKNRTLLARATFPNVDGLLIAGMLVRVRLASLPYKALVVPDSAVWNDILAAGDVTNVFVVNAKNTIEVRTIEPRWRLSSDNLTVVTKGLQADDRVVLLGSVRPKEGTVVNPRIVPFPETKLPGKETKQP